MTPKRTLRAIPNTRVILWVVVFFIAALMIVGFVLEAAARDAERDIKRADNFLLKTRTVQAVMSELDSNQRGYVISNKDAFLQLYNEAKNRLPQLWTDLASEAAELDQQSKPSVPLSGQVSRMKSAADTWQTQVADQHMAMVKSGRVQEAL